MLDLTVTMVAFNCAPTVEYAISSIYPWARQIVIAYGRAGGNEASFIDNTLSKIEDYPDPDGKVTLLAKDEWDSLVAMRNATAEKVACPWHLQLDGDELWTGVGEWLEHFGRSRVVAAIPLTVNFWHSTSHWVHNGYGYRSFGRVAHDESRLGSRMRSYRFSSWAPGTHWQLHWRPRGPRGKDLFRFSRVLEGLPTRRWHMGWALPRSYVLGKGDKRWLRWGDQLSAWANWHGETGRVTSGNFGCIVDEVECELPEIVRECEANVCEERAE